MFRLGRYEVRIDLFHFDIDARWEMIYFAWISLSGGNCGINSQLAVN